MHRRWYVHFLFLSFEKYPFQATSETIWAFILQLLFALAVWISSLVHCLAPNYEMGFIFHLGESGRIVYLTSLQFHISSRLYVRIGKVADFWVENLFCAGTYKRILDAIARPAVEKAKIKLSTRIDHINASTGTVKLSTNDGQELEFDEVVMTNPLGWLKNNKRAFQPPLPARFSQAIDAIGYGSLEKVGLLSRRKVC